jgi:hypothetical protein
VIGMRILRAKAEEEFGDYDIFACLECGWGLRLPDGVEPIRDCPKCGGPIDHNSSQKMPKQKDGEDQRALESHEPTVKLIDAVRDLKREPGFKMVYAEQMENHEDGDLECENWMNHTVPWPKGRTRPN